ncbi:MAG: FdhF/YdeP family oxidoreductase [Chloroherpetonaceae bacterium]
MSARFDHEGSDKANAVEQSPTPIATTPILPDDEALKVGKAKEVAAGIPAVVSATKHAISEMGVARGMKMLLEVNQMGGFDCPGCAWPDPDDHRAVAEFCENGVKAIAEEATKKRVTADFFRQHSVYDLSKRTDYWLGKQGRLVEPMVLRQGATHYEPISWREAFELIAKHLNALASPDEAIFYTSGRTSNEAAFLYQLFVRQFGTNNLPDCSNMCHESSGVGLKETIGIGKGTVKLSDFDLADVILVIGQNPGTNHPRMLSALQSAVRKGAKVVHINPLPETGLKRFKHPQNPLDLLGKGTELAHMFLQVRINGDIALLKGVMKELLAAEESSGNVFDKKFIAEHTTGYDALIADLKATSWDIIIEQSGISREQIKALADLIKTAKTMISCWAMGLTQHKNGVANIQTVTNLHLLLGHIGKPGAGLCPVRGHSNVQGDRTMGIHEKPAPAFLQSLQHVFGFEPPQKHGYNVVEAIKAMYEGKAKVFIAMGGNFLSATPDTNYTAKALRNTNLTVHVSTKLNRAHLITGKEALILPCLGRTERDMQKGGLQFVSVENSMGIVHSSQGSLPPASEHLLSEPAIVAGIAKATLGARSKVDWDWLIEDYDRIRDLIERTIPGFERYNERVREKAGFYLPNGAREGMFNTSDKKAHFTVHPIPIHRLEKGQYIMMTIRSHDQYNTTIYGLDDRYRGIYNGRRIIFMNPDDMREANLKQGDIVDLISHFNGERRVAKHFVVVPFNIPKQCTATYFPETNVLVPIDSYADKSQTPTSKFILMTLQPSKGTLADVERESELVEAMM